MTSYTDKSELDQHRVRERIRVVFTAEEREQWQRKFDDAIFRELQELKSELGTEYR